MNGNTMGFRPQIQKFELHYMSPQLTLGARERVCAHKHKTGLVLDDNLVYLERKQFLKISLKEDFR